MLTLPLLPDYAQGRGHRGFIPGARIETIAEVREGDVLIEVVHTFRAINTVVCLKGACLPHEFGQIAYFQFLCSMSHKPPGGMAIWNHEVGAQRPTVALYRAIIVDETHGDHAYAEQEISRFYDYAKTSRDFCFRPVPVPGRDTIEGVTMGPLGLRDNRNLE